MTDPNWTDYVQPVENGYRQMTDAEYAAFPAVNASILKHETQCEMLHALTHPRADESLTLGTLVHAMILEPWKFDDAHWRDYFVESPTKGLDTKAAQQVREANPGKLLITVELLQQAKEVSMHAIETHPDVRRYLSSPDGKREIAGIAWDPVNQVRRKMRLDYLPMIEGKYGNYIADIKTTSKPLSEFWREALKFGYYKSAAWYLDTHELVTNGHRPDMFVWIVVTTTKPYMTRLFYMLNRRPDDPEYAGSRLQTERALLGIDTSVNAPPRIGRLQMFTAAVHQTRKAALANQTLTPKLLRSIWTGYEQEQPMQELK